MVLQYYHGSWLGYFVSSVDKAHTNITVPFLYCIHTAVSIARVAHYPSPQLPVGSRAPEHVACRHRKHPSHPLVCGITPAGSDSSV